MNRNIVLKALVLGAALFSAGLAGAQRYFGPKCLGLYCVDRDTLVSNVMKKLGPSPARSSEFAPYCYESPEQKVFLYLRSAEAVPPTVDAILLSDFPICANMPVAFAKDELNGWKTPQGIGLGSSEQDVLNAYGKPSREEKIDSRIYKELIKGYKKGDPLPDAGEKELVYGAGATAGDLSLAHFTTTTISGHANDNLAVIAAVVLGGTSLFGGVGTMFGSTIGIFIPAVLESGFVIMGIQTFWQDVAVGAVLIVAVYLDQLRRRARARQ